MYKPKPIDTRDIELPESLMALTEQIAENVHDIWAVNKIKEGWTYGETKDLVKKTTPQLVPYSELPERDKEYDRNTAMETLRLIVKLGYEISENK